MKKITFLLLVCTTVLFAGCGTSQQGPTEKTTTSINQETFEWTMKDVFKKWGQMTCTMTSKEDGVQIQGTLYLDGKTMRTDATGAAEGMSFKMSSIIKNGYAYSRTNMAKDWWKSAYDESEIEEWLDSPTADIESPMSFSCKKGISSSSVFDLPRDILFKEISQN